MKKRITRSVFFAQWDESGARLHVYCLCHYLLLSSIALYFVLFGVGQGPTHGQGCVIRLVSSIVSSLERLWITSFISRKMFSILMIYTCATAEDPQ